MRRFLDFFVFEMCCSGVRFRMAAVLATLGALRLDGALRALAQSLESVSRSRNGSSQRERHSTVTRKRLRRVPKLRQAGVLQRSEAMPRWSLPRQRAATISPSLQPREPPREPNSIPRFRHRRSCSISAHVLFPRVPHAPKSLRNLSACAHRHDPKGSRFVLCTRSTHDARFPKYPPLPVTRCDGFEQTASSAAPVERS